MNNANKNIPSFSQFKANVLRFMDRCAVSAGIADEAAWNAAHISSVSESHAARFIKPPGERIEAMISLEERRHRNNWMFASTPGGTESIEGTHSAVEALFLLGELDRLSNANKRAWVHYFNRYQDKETGYYLGPYVPARDHYSWVDPKTNTHPWSHMHDHLISCLCPTLMLLNGQSKFPLSSGSMTGRFLDRNYLEHYLHGRDWNNYRNDLNFRRHNPWWMGNEFWYPACILWQISLWESGTAAARQARKLLDEVWYGWHDANFGVNGFWYGDLDGEPDRFWQTGLPAGDPPSVRSTHEQRYWSAMTIMGGAHQLWFYDFDNHPIPDAVRRAQTDAVLEIQNCHNNHFGLGDIDNPHESSCNCTDVDCMTVLAMNYHRLDYRRLEIRDSLKRAATAILSDKINRDGVLVSVQEAPFTHCFNSWPTYSPAGQANMLDQSFYLWAIISACSIIDGDDIPATLSTFARQKWPQVPSHWLWTPMKTRQ